MKIPHRLAYAKRKRFLPLATVSLTAALVISACEADELDVSYLDIAEVSVARDNEPEADGIAAVRVVRAETSLGFYPVPARVPVLGTGPVRLTVEPAVRRSGLSGELLVYPFYEPFRTTANLSPGRADTVRPDFRYRDDAVVALEEGFEASTSVFILDQVPGGSPTLTRTTDSARAGRFSGVIEVTPADPVFEVASVVIDPGRATVLDLWVELDYRGDGVLALALIPPDPVPTPAGTPLSSRYFQGALPRNDWTKLYFDIVDASNADFVAEGFRVSLLAIYDENLGPRQRLFLDNLRVVYR